MKVAVANQKRDGNDTTAVPCWSVRIPGAARCWSVDLTRMFHDQYFGTDPDRPASSVSNRVSTRPGAGSSGHALCWIPSMKISVCCPRVHLWLSWSASPPRQALLAVVLSRASGAVVG